MTIVSCILYFGWFPSLWILYACLFHRHRRCKQLLTPSMKMEQSVPKRRNTKFRVWNRLK